jgi:hypothetical protein
MSKIVFEDDFSSRKVVRFFLFLQITAVITVISLIIFDFYSFALAISCTTFIVFAAGVMWLYYQYQKIPIVREKRDLQQRVVGLQNKIRVEDNIIQSAKKKREEFFQAEKNEINSTLHNLQQKYIQNGLATSSVKDAVISGVGPKLKERLAEYGIVNAAHITNKISEIPGFGEAKRQALATWRNSIVARLDSTKPVQLSDEQFSSINQKYVVLHNENDANQKKAQDSKLNLEEKVIISQRRLDQLAPITFVAYLSKSMASQGIVAGSIALLLITTQVVSSVSATTSSIIASIPTATATPTMTLTPTTTLTPTITSTPTITDTPTITSTPTASSMPSGTNTSTITFTPSATFPPTRTRTLIPTVTQPPVINPLQGVTAICMDGSYSYSQHRQGTCSHHGGVKQWINKPPN